MSLIYKNPTSSTALNSTNSVTRANTIGTNFSVLQTGGYMELYNLSDLVFTIPEGDTGSIQFSGNSIPVQYSKRSLPFLPDSITLSSDNISSGRRRLGMLVYVHETQQTYQYTIPNYETLWDGASGSTQESDFGTTITTSTTGGEAFVNAWLDSSIEGVSGVTRENARWRIFYGTDWQITGGTYNSGTGTLSLDNNTGGTINVTGFTTGGGSDTYVTGGTYSSGTTTLTLTRNDGNTVDVTGFTSGGGGSLTLQDVTDNGSTTTRAISVRSLTSDFDLTINEGITAGNGGGDISTNTVFGANALDSNTTGNGNSAFGTWTLSATTASGNSAFGSLALYKNTTGNNNTAIGKNAMHNGTNSAESVAVGSEAFYSGGGNTGVAIGYQAGYGVTTAGGSILIGYRAGYDITDNSRNIAIGYESLRFNDEGTFNVAIGDTALHGNRSGNFNVGVGNDALVGNTTGLRNVGVGSDSLSNNQTGNDNVALGFEAGQDTAGSTNGTSNNSIFIGKGTKASVTNGSNEIVIGTDAIGNGSNTITLGNTGHTDTYLFGTVHGVPYLTGGSYSNGTLTLEDVDGGSFDITGFTSGGDTGGITFNQTTISAADDEIITIQSLDVDSIIRSKVVLDPDNGSVQLESFSLEDNRSYTDSSWSSGIWEDNGFGNGRVVLVGASTVYDFLNDNLNNAEWSFSINGSATKIPSQGWGYTNATQTLSIDTGSGNYPTPSETVTSIEFFYNFPSEVNVNWDDEELQMYARGDMDIEIRSFEQDIRIDAEVDLRLTGGDDVVITQNSTTKPIRFNVDTATFNLNNDGTIELPVGGDIVDTNGNSLLSGDTSISAITYNSSWGLSENLTDGTSSTTDLPFITGGTYSSGTITLGINGGLESDISITGIDGDDTYLTGATYTPTTLTLGMSDDTVFNVTGFAPEITGGTLSNGTLSLLDNTNGSVEITGFTTSGNLYSTDGQLSGDRVVDQNSNSLTFSGGSVSMGTGTTSPVCALIEMASTNQGLLIPRMTQVQRLAINTPLPGLLLYCTDTDSNGEEGMYMYKSIGWVNVL